jgi:hypothetical protein
LNYSDEEIEAAMRKFHSLPRSDPQWQEAFQLLDGLGLITIDKMRSSRGKLKKAKPLVRSCRPAPAQTRSVCPKPLTNKCGILRFISWRKGFGMLKRGVQRLDFLTSWQIAM